MTDAWPGRVSSFELAGGTLTLQTELRGQPPEVVTLVDYGGRVIQSRRRPLHREELDDPQTAARLAHASVVSRVLASLRRAGKRRPANAQADRTGAELFVMALQARDRGEVATARGLVAVAEAMLPADPRVRELREALDEN